MPRRLELIALGVATCLAGCAPSAGADPTRCTAATGNPSRVVELFFGRTVPPLGEVTDRDWDGFVDRVVTPALPNGFTVYDASGAWRNPRTGNTIRERSKVLQVALPDTPDSLAAVEWIRRAFEVEFHQQRVGMITAAACASF